MRRLLYGLLLLMVAAPVGLAGWMYLFVQQEISVAEDSQELVLEHGLSLRSIADRLVTEQVLQEPWRFVLLVRVMGRERDIKAGNYELKRGMTVNDLFLTLTQGSSIQRSITFIEGWTFQQMREALNRHEDIRHLSVAMTDQEIMQHIGAKENHPEGLFFPDSYFFTRSSSDIDILKRAYHTMQRRLQQAWEGRSAGLPYQTPYEALILASLIEKETGRGEERPLIARVFLNRLQLNMRLQTDPTVIYGMGERFDGNLRRHDLTQDTPYNTYTRGGLPPTPIAMPGMAAIHAALHPADGNALYFVSRGDGSHVFSATLDEHNRAVNQYQRSRK